MLTNIFKVEINVPAQYLADVLEGAGSRYWCERLRFDEAKTGTRSCWEALLAGDIDRVRVVVRPELEDNKSARHYVTRASLAAAFQLMRDSDADAQIGSSLGVAELGAALGDSAHQDANTGDALLQYAALGELRFS